MNSQHSILYRLAGSGLLALGIILVLAPTGRTQAPPREPSAAEREKMIGDIEKQIQELQSQLKMMKDKELLPTPKPLQTDPLSKEFVNALRWRNIGPPNMGGRVTAIAMVESDPSMYWVATASGGLLKTSNNGSTFEHQFDRESTVSIGTVAVAPSNKNIVWVGTGEANPRNSVSYGDGVYKSVDGGKSWQNVGLKKSFQIASIAIHPKNPDVVYVGALGRLYGANEERGLFKTTDGGKTWNRILFVDDKTGVMDVAMHPTDPETLLIATWERKRDEYDSFRGDARKPDGTDEYAPVVTHGAGSGLWKTTDGGKNFKRLTKGLPTVKMGRIGIEYFRKNPNLVFATIDTEDAGKGLPPTDAYLGVLGKNRPEGGAILTVTSGSPADKAGIKNGDVLTSLDGKPVKVFDDVTPILAPKQPGDVVKVVVIRDKDNKSFEVTLGKRGGGGGQKGPAKEGGPKGPRPGIGIQVEDDDGGVKIAEIIKESSADKAGLKVGDLITKLDGNAVENRLGLLRPLSQKAVGDKVKVEYVRGKETKTVEMELAVAPPQVPTGRPYSAGQLGGQVANVQGQQGPDGFQTGGLYKSTDLGETWTRVNSFNPRPFYFSQVRVDPSDENIIWSLGVDLHLSTDGGANFSNQATIKDEKGNPVKDENGRERTYTVDRGVHSDQHAMWVNPKDGRHLILGTDGGFYVSYDRGQNWEHLNNFAMGQFYHVAVDNQTPYRVYGGLQDNGSWGGPSQTFRNSGPTNEDFVYVNGGDGFVMAVDRDNPNMVYSESQDGRMSRRDLKTGATTGISPRGGAGIGPFRWNWNSPFILSSHNSSIFYSGANYVFRSVKQGADLKAISPDITRTKRGSATALAESPKNPEVLWVGTDDGAVQVTKDGGKNWINVTDNFKAAGLPGPRWVASIEASRTDARRAYVVFDAHRSNDDEPYVFSTDDYGATWKSIRSNLPTGSTRVLREDAVNQNLLYLGTEFGAFASVDRGISWTKINGGAKGLPTVAVHEFAQPTTANEIVAATHGRSLWILDVTSLRQMTTEVAKGKTTLFTPNSVIRWQPEIGKEGMFSTGTRRFVGQNPARGTFVEITLDRKPAKATLKIQDIQGKTVREFPVRNDAGFQSFYWDLRPGSGAGSFGPGGGGGGRGNFLPESPTGQYRAVLNVDGTELVKSFTVDADPRAPKVGAVINEVEALQQLEELLNPPAILNRDK